MGDQVAGQIDTQASKAQSKIGETQSVFNQKVQENSVGLNENLLNEAVSDSANFVKDAEKVNQFSRMRDATYKGPSGIEDLEDYQGLQTDFNKAQELLNSSQNESGRQTLLNETFKRSDYTSGQNKLDQLLLQNDPNARSTFSNLQSKYSGLSGLLSGAQTSAAEQARLAKEATDATRQKIATTFGREDDLTTQADERAGVLGQFQTDLDNKVKNYKEGDGNTLNRLNEAMLSRQFDDDLLKLLDLSDGQRTYNINLDQYRPTAVDPMTINPANVASSEDYSRYQALQKLLNGTPTLLPSERTYSAPTLSEYDKAGLKGAIQQAEQAYNTAYTTNKDGILDNTLFVNPNADPSRMIPWNRVDEAHKGVDSFLKATPKELEEYWYPLMNQLANETGYASERQNANAILQSVRNWQAAQGFNNQIKKKQVT